MITGAAAIGAGTLGGVFFAFSTFVMPALRRLPAPAGIRVMQAVNRAAPESRLFMTALLGSAALAAVVGAAVVDDLDEPNGLARLAGAALSLASVAVTAGYHVPRNERLARLDPSHPGAAEEWRRYLQGWTRWNHVRALLSVTSCAALGVAASR